MEERKIVVPGETIISGEEFLPGDGTRREEKDIVAGRFGLADVSDKLIRIIPLSGVYIPRRGNTLIGEISDITFNGWIIDFGGSVNGFLPVAEVPKYINKGELREFLDFGDVVVAKVGNADGGRSIDLTIKLRGLGKLSEGMIIKVNPNKVPRIIGKEGSMVNMIKEASGVEITVGQNGWIWVRGKKIDDELKTKKIIDYVCENSFIGGLTDKVGAFIKKLK